MAQGRTTLCTSCARGSSVRSARLRLVTASLVYCAYTGRRVVVRSKLRLQQRLRNLEWIPITLRWQEFAPDHVALTTYHEHRPRPPLNT